MPYSHWCNHLALFRAAIPDRVRWGSAFEGEGTNDHGLSCPRRATRSGADGSEGGKSMKRPRTARQAGDHRPHARWLVCGVLWGYFLPQHCWPSLTLSTDHRSAVRLAVRARDAWLWGTHPPWPSWPAQAIRVSQYRNNPCCTGICRKKRAPSGSHPH